MPFANNGEARLYWRLEGAADKRALLLLNAIGTDLGSWDRVAPFLAPHFHLLRTDTRGHGASSSPTGNIDMADLADDAFAVMDAAGIERGAVCGLSLGGMIAMEMALRRPERIEALALACTSARMDAEVWAERERAVREGGVAAIAEAALGRFFSPRFARRHPEVVDSTRSSLLATSAEAYAGCCAAIGGMRLADRLGEIAVPTLVIAGPHDLSTPFAGHGGRIAAGVAGARVAILDTGHLACLEAPAEFAEAVRTFLDGEATRASLDDASAALYEAGLVNRRRILGDAWVDASLAGRTDFNADFQAMITRIAWREIWGRPGLDDRTRRLLVLAITAALGRWEEFRLHVRAGLQHDGFTRGELKETLMQTAIYAGVPAANTAFAQAADVIADLDAHAPTVAP